MKDEVKLLEIFLARFGSLLSCCGSKVEENNSLNFRITITVVLCNSFRELYRPPLTCTTDVASYLRLRNLSLDHPGQLLIAGSVTSSPTLGKKINLASLFIIVKIG